MGRDDVGEPDYRVLLEDVRSELSRGAERGVGLQLVCDLVTKRIPHYDWFGFYFSVPAQQLLVLGPFEGKPTEHVRIPYGSGICGQAAVTGETFVVADVTAESNYLACSISVQSELVVPVFSSGRFLGEVDVDSHLKGAFTEKDRGFLEALAVNVAPYMPRL